jgi:exodeoxyribonuclease V alpha subunit
MMETCELSAIDRHFARFICREAGDASPWLRLAAALASNAVAAGHICLNLPEIAGREVRVDGEEVIFPPLPDLTASLGGTLVVGRPGDFRPLVLDKAGRLYLYRYWRYECDLGRVILEKAAAIDTGAGEAASVEPLGRLFGGASGEGPDWQKVAALAAVRKRFCVISGGPGTGKTSTVVKIIALLLEEARGRELRIALAAPTGKSAARLRESIRLMKERLECAPEVRAGIPDEVSTIHRLLGAVGGSVRFRHSSANPLPHDVVIVDEASMVALPLMAKLATALRTEARLILLGDRDQLASVEAGAVLGDICGGGRAEPFSPEFVDHVARTAGETIQATSDGEPVPLCDSLVILKRNYRFGADSGIGALGRRVNAGEGGAALELMKGGEHAEVCWQGAPGPDSMKAPLAGAVVAGYGAYLAAGSPGEAIALFDAFRILSPLRQGPWGVNSVNAAVEEILAARGLIDVRSRWYRGRPVMITVNDYHMKLFNGDVGIVLPDPEAGGLLRVFFPAPDGGVRKVTPVRLPPHETVYAMTIHKSQGSEFDRVLMLLPGHDSEVLTRELIYTGITRAKRRVEIWGDEAIFVEAVARRTVRKSGLRDLLWPEAEVEAS